jgi:hypothetical protein
VLLNATREALDGIVFNSRILLPPPFTSVMTIRWDGGIAGYLVKVQEASRRLLSDNADGVTVVLTSTLARKHSE